MSNIDQQTDMGKVTEWIEQHHGESPGERLDYIKGGFMGAPGAFHIDEISWVS